MLNILHQSLYLVNIFAVQITIFICYFVIIYDVIITICIILLIKIELLFFVQQLIFLYALILVAHELFIVTMQ